MLSFIMVAVVLGMGVESLGQEQLDKLPLLTKDNFKYVGAFRVASGDDGDSTFSYGGTAIAVNPKSNSLFIVGHDHHQAVAEVSIPIAINSTQTQDLETARTLQPFVRLLDRVPKQTLTGNTKIGGLQVVDGKLLGTAYEFYDAEANAVDSHFRLSSLDLESAKVEGFFGVGNIGGGFVGGYMAEVPAEWRSFLGMPFLTGQAGIAIISRTSSGPAVFGFDPKDLGKNSATALPYVYYPINHQNLGFGTGGFNGTSRVDGVMFAPKTRSVLFFGSEGTGEIGYGEPADFNDHVASGKGYCSRNGQYEFRVWAYDAHEFGLVISGNVHPWDLKPYRTWSFEFPTGPASYRLGGATFDRKSNRLYLSQLGADRFRYDVNPLIHVYDLVLDSASK